MEMEIAVLLSGLAAAIGVGFGAGIGARVLPHALRAHRDLKASRTHGAASHPHAGFTAQDRGRKKLSQPDGTRRDSSIVGLAGNALRHNDGSYSGAWEAELPPSMLDHDDVIEGRCDELARMLAVDKPAGTVLQFRFSSGPDPGRAIDAHLKACGDPSLVHPEAARLHAMNLGFYEEAAAENRYRHSVLSVWARVPAKQPGDETGSGMSAFLPYAAHEIRKQGIVHLSQVIKRSWVETADDGVVRRILAEERAAREKAERVFRLVERECPLSLRRFDRDRLWEAVYLGHRQNAQSIPILSDLPGIDIRDYLCGETIEGGGWYVMHGSHPAAIVSMFTPPQPMISADMLRALVFNPGLNFRHTLVAEFVYLDQRKASKRLDRRIRQVRRTHVRADGRIRQSPEARAALTDLEQVRDHLTGSREALIEARFYAVVYAPPSRRRDELARSLRELDESCERMVAAMKSIPGVEAAREDPEPLHSLYPRVLVAEADARPTGREITEVAGSLAALIPAESPWSGARRPHTLCSTPAGALVGLDLFDRAVISSPLTLILGQPGSGKSTLMARIINDTLATLPLAHVRAVDFGESLGPHVDVLHGRHLRFSVDDPRAVNIWDYPGLESGDPPDETQIALVVMDAMRLARVRPDDSIAEDILTNIITEVYRNEAPRNGPGRPRCEPTHSHLLAMLDSYPFQAQAVRDRAATLAVALEKYRDHPWIDSPTHPDFAADSSYDVYELDSLDSFPQDVRETLAGRVAARVLRSIGQLRQDGTRTPTLLVFDEVWKIRDKYPRILEVIRRGARQGRKENAVTLLATQAYEDFAELHDVTRTAGVKIIGKQIGGCPELVADAGLSENAVAALSAIRNIAGEYAQFVMALGSGQDQITEMIQIDLAPAELWTFTTNPYERNARARVSALRPQWCLAEVIAWLAAVYPRGLAAAGLAAIDETLHAGE
jgi:hypothetical protein